MSARKTITRVSPSPPRLAHLFPAPSRRLVYLASPPRYPDLFSVNYGAGRLLDSLLGPSVPLSHERRGIQS
ncbi:hypothetical protein O3P69_000590 [Scylla paramamosain]|uniref:Uncharacterized protein n=1 Tax=Scylla paramamosain TaxID=85552 RepID=A0AAW0URH2_SCYPA